jgi:hypothetical protein
VLDYTKIKYCFVRLEAFPAVMGLPEPLEPGLLPEELLALELLEPELLEPGLLPEVPLPLFCSIL